MWGTGQERCEGKNPDYYITGYNCQSISNNVVRIC